MPVAGAATDGPPGALIRGGSFLSGTEVFDFGSAGPFAVRAVSDPSFTDAVGFRGAR